ncbi:MAG: hypothetical protein AB7O97_18570 [Planctomycetota bacterium]
MTRRTSANRAASDEAPRAVGRRAGRARERGVAYLLLMVVLAGFGTLLTVALPRQQSAAAGHLGTVERRLGDLRRAALRGHRQGGAFAASLDALATQAGLESAGAWRADPFAAGADLRYRVRGRPRQLTVQSRGPDGRYNTADDPRFDLSEQEVGRGAGRARLRLLRAQLVDWQATAGTAAMTPTDRQALQAAVGRTARARRTYVYADAAARAALDAAMAADLDSIRALRAAYGVAFPGRVTGTGGLMAAVGWSDALAVDAWGQSLLWDEALGVTSRGGDRRRSTPDDY